MLLELTEILRCPADHEESYVVCVTYAVDGSRVIRGVIGCPVCRAEYPIVDGVADLRGPAYQRTGAPGYRGTGAVGHGGREERGRRGDAATCERSEHRSGEPRRSRDAAPVARPDVPGRGETLTAEAAATFLGLRGPGGYVLLAGSAARLAGDLAALVPGVHVVCVNAPADGARSPSASYLLAEGGVPVKSSWMRGVALGADCAAGPWLAEGVRLVLDGLRVVVESESAEVPGVVEMARGAGVVVWERRPR